MKYFDNLLGGKKITVDRVFIMLVILMLVINTGYSQKLGKKTDKPEKDLVHKKINSKLSELYKAYKNERINSSDQKWQDIDLQDNASKVQVIVKISSESSISILEQEVEKFNGKLESSYKNYVQLLLPIDHLVDIAERVQQIDYIAPPHPSKPYKVDTSEGVELINADKFQEEGIKGEGVKVAIIDGGFDNLSEVRASGDVPDSVIAYKKDFTSDDDFQTGGNHGTDIAEIIHDIAPAADLYLMKHSTSVELGNAVDAAINNGVDIINYSYGWWNTNFYDGTGVIANIAADANDQGVIFVNSAGNGAQNHWQGSWNDSNDNDFIEFSSGDELQGIGYVEEGEQITLYMSWDAWPHEAEDYDLNLYRTDASGDLVLVSSSEGLQDGSEGQFPTETIDYTVSTADNYYFAIENYSAPSTPDIEIFSRRNKDFEYNKTSSSLIAPANEQKVVTVGAISHNDWVSGPLETFSARGPTNDSKFTDSFIKPDVMGPDGVSTSGYGSFYGTSAAAPHTVGALALKLSNNPQQNNENIIEDLYSSAIDMGNPGKDNLYGHGRLNIELQNNGNNPPLRPLVSDQVQKGNQFTVSVQVGEAANPVQNLFGTSFELTYNQSHMSYVDHELGSFLGDDLVSNVTNESSNGIVDVGMSRKSGDGGVDGHGTLLELTFDASSDISSETEVSFGLQDVTAKDPAQNNIALSPESATTTIVVGLTVWPGDMNNDSDGEVDGADVLPVGAYYGLTGPARSESDQGCEWKAYTVPRWDPPEATYADANGDGEVDGSDILCIGFNYGKTHSTNNSVVASRSGTDRSLTGEGLEYELVKTGENNYRMKLINERYTDLYGVSFDLSYQSGETKIMALQHDYDRDGYVSMTEVQNKEGRAGLGISATSDQRIGQGQVAEVHLESTAERASVALRDVTIMDDKGDTETLADEVSVSLQGTGQKQEKPRTVRLLGNYPNPFNPSTQITYQLDKRQQVALHVYSMAGKKITTLTSGIQQAGRHQVTFNADGLSSGVYIYKLITTEKILARKMLLVK